MKIQDPRPGTTNPQRESYKNIDHVHDDEAHDVSIIISGRENGGSRR